MNKTYKQVCRDLDLTDAQRVIVFAYGGLSVSKNTLNRFRLASNHPRYKKMDRATLEVFSKGLTELDREPLIFDDDQINEARGDIASAIFPW